MAQRIECRAPEKAGHDAARQGWPGRRRIAHAVHGRIGLAPKVGKRVALPASYSRGESNAREIVQTEDAQTGRVIIGYLRRGEQGLARRRVREIRVAQLFRAVSGATQHVNTVFAAQSGEVANFKSPRFG